jgi:hypothetical protein
MIVLVVARAEAQTTTDMGQSLFGKHTTEVEKLICFPESALSQLAPAERSALRLAVIKGCPIGNSTFVFNSVWLPVSGCFVTVHGAALFCRAFSE